MVSYIRRRIRYLHLSSASARCQLVKREPGSYAHLVHCRPSPKCIPHLPSAPPAQVFTPQHRTVLVS